jgi:hypothetical protein
MHGLQCKGNVNAEGGRVAAAHLWPRKKTSLFVCWQQNIREDVCDVIDDARIEMFFLVQDIDAAYDKKKDTRENRPSFKILSLHSMKAVETATKKRLTVVHMLHHLHVTRKHCKKLLQFIMHSLYHAKHFPVNKHCQTTRHKIKLHEHLHRKEESCG